MGYGLSNGRLSGKIDNPLKLLFYAVIGLALDDIKKITQNKAPIGANSVFHQAKKYGKERLESVKIEFLSDALFFLIITWVGWLEYYGDVLSDIDMNKLDDFIQIELNKLGVGHFIPLFLQYRHRLLSSKTQSQQLIKPL